MDLRMGWVIERTFNAASKLAGSTAAASCTQSTGLAPAARTWHSAIRERKV
jgi:hypothetical protein